MSRFYLQDTIKDEEFHEEEITISRSLVHINNRSLGCFALKAHRNGVYCFKLKTFKLQIRVSKVADVAGIYENSKNRRCKKRREHHNQGRAEALLPQGSQSTEGDAGPQTAYIFSHSRRRGDQLSVRLQG